MNEDAYLADVAGLHYNISQEGVMGIEIKVEGFSDKIRVLASRIFETLATASTAAFEPSAFSREKEALIRKLSNANMQVQKHASYNRLFALCSQAYHVDAVLGELKTVEISDVTLFTAQVLSECHIEALIMGNLTLEEALSICKSAKSCIGDGCRMVASERKKERCIKIPSGPSLQFSEKTKNADEDNCGVEIYFQCCSGGDPKDRAAVDLLEQIISEPAYNQLRTREQLGYTVYSGMRLTHGILGFCFGVVSSKMSSEGVEARVDAFLDHFASDKLSESLSSEEFEKHRASLASIKLQKDKALHEEVSRHWEDVWNERYDFLTRELELKALLEIDAGSVKDFFLNHMRSGSPRRISIHICPSKSAATVGTVARTLSAAKHEEINDLQAWKSAQEVHPLPSAQTL